MEHRPDQNDKTPEFRNRWLIRACDVALGATVALFGVLCVPTLVDLCGP